MSKYFRFIIFLIFATFVVVYSYSQSDVGLSDEEYEKLKSIDESPFISSIGLDKKNGNLLGIQPYMSLSDYSTESRFYNKIEKYLILAKREGYLNSGSIVVFPEHIGTPLFLMDEKKEVYTTEDFEKVKSALLYPRYYKYIYHYLTTSSTGDKSAQILFRMKGARMRDSYVKIFSQLSKFYNITILAGSILLPGGKIEGNMIQISNEDLRNLPVVFSKGQIENISLSKKYLSNFEENFINTQENNLKPTVNIPNIKNPVSILFSKDGLYNPLYTSEVSNSDIIINSVAVSNKEKIVWQEPEISDTIKGDKSLFSESDRSITKEELWNKFGITGKFMYLNNRIYLQLFLRGEFYGHKLYGNSTMGYRYLKYESVPSEYREAILNIYY
jgi:hypothetical protein